MLVRVGPFYRSLHSIKRRRRLADRPHRANQRNCFGVVAEVCVHNLRKKPHAFTSALASHRRLASMIFGVLAKRAYCAFFLSDEEF
jgi:hypothetical protein